jgi:hypothetical protein
MFSDHLEIIDKLPTKKMFLVAAVLVIVCQLVAVVLVADGQVEKAQSRQASRASFQSALAACFENSRGASLKTCSRLVPSDSDSALNTPPILAAESDPQSLMLVRLANQP